METNVLVAKKLFAVQIAWYNLINKFMQCSVKTTRQCDIQKRCLQTVTLYVHREEIKMGTTNIPKNKDKVIKKILHLVFFSQKVVTVSFKKNFLV